MKKIQEAFGSFDMKSYSKVLDPKQHYYGVPPKGPKSKSKTALTLNKLSVDEPPGSGALLRNPEALYASPPVHPITSSPHLLTVTSHLPVITSNHLISADNRITSRHMLAASSHPLINLVIFSRGSPHLSSINRRLPPPPAPVCVCMQWR